jgi:hypothetical protein
MDEARPMLWKELFIERVATLGRFGRWAGSLLTAGLLGVSLGLTGVIVADALFLNRPGLAAWALDLMHVWVGEYGFVLGFLLECAIGLRAGVSISSERERGTWDALLTSPLDAGEIVRGKLWGSLYALRWLIVATFLAWTLSAATGAEGVTPVVTRVAEVLTVGTFMAAVGVRTSLSSQTATKAMAVTVGVWLGAIVVVGVLSTLALLLGLLLCNVVWIALSYTGVVPPLTALWLPVSGFIAWPVARDGLYLLATVLVVADTRLRFDRIAGRITEGQLATALDALIYGRPEAPVPLAVEDPEEVESLVNDRLA